MLELPRVVLWLFFRLALLVVVSDTAPDNALPAFMRLIIPVPALIALPLWIVMSPCAFKVSVAALPAVLLTAAVESTTMCPTEGPALTVLTVTLVPPFSALLIALSAIVAVAVGAGSNVGPALSLVVAQAQIVTSVGSSSQLPA